MTYRRCNNEVIDLLLDDLGTASCYTCKVLANREGCGNCKLYDAPKFNNIKWGLSDRAARYLAIRIDHIYNAEIEDLNLGFISSMCLGYFIFRYGGVIRPNRKLLRNKFLKGSFLYKTRKIITRVVRWIENPVYRWVRKKVYGFDKSVKRKNIVYR